MTFNILIVDDSQVMRKMIKKTINLCNFDIAEIYEAGNGKEGIRTLNKKKVDLLFIDINMPVMDGMEMLREVRGQPKTANAAVFIVSAESNSDRIKTIEDQNTEFIHKPFTPEVLRSKILGIMS